MSDLDFDEIKDALNGGDTSFAAVYIANPEGREKLDELIKLLFDMSDHIYDLREQDFNLTLESIQTILAAAATTVALRLRLLH